MAPKRRHSDDGFPQAKERRGGNDQRERLGVALSGLNEQFASWVTSNKDTNVHLLWVEGVRDYVQHATKLLGEYKDVAPPEGITALQQAAADATSSHGRRREGQSSAAKAGSSRDERAVGFVRGVASLNRQFARWVATSLETTPRMWWLEAARDYVLHANRLLESFADVISTEASTQPATTAAAAAATAGSAAANGGAEAEERAAAPVGLFSSRSPAPTTATANPSGFGFAPFGNLGGPLAGPAAASGALFGAAASQPASGGKGTAPATGFMAATPAAAASSAASSSSFFGSFAVPTITTGTGTDAATNPKTSTGVFGFSFASAPASAPASAVPEAVAAPSGKDAVGDKHATAAFPFSGPNAAAKEMASGAAAAAAAGDKLTAGPQSAPPEASAPAAAPSAAAGAPAIFGGGMFQFGVQPSSTSVSMAAVPPPSSTSGGTTASTGTSVTFGVVSSETVKPNSIFTFGGAASASAGSGSTTAATTTPSFTFGGASASTAASSSNDDPAGLSGPVFGGSSAAAGGSTAFSFGSAPATTSAADGSGADGDAAKKDGGDVAKKDGGSGGGDTAPAAASGGFSFFGAATAAPAGGTAPTTGSFSFGSAAPGFSLAPKPAAAAAAEAEAEDNEPEPEPDECAKEPSLKVDDNVDFLFREKARLQLPVKGPDGKLSGWEAKGTGMLSIRKAKTEGAKPYIALFTDAGRCLYQAYIYKTMKLVVSDKQKSVAFSAVWSPDGTSPPTMNPALFQLAITKNRAFEAVVLKLQEEMSE